MPISSGLVHLFTALGIVCALMATLAVSAGQYEIMFAWLGVAIVIDGLDGPLARSIDVKTRLPRFSGERLDLIIDYVTYVFVPVLALFHAKLVPDPVAVPTGALILLSSLYHFSDTESKADDNSFIGFPAIWNIVALYLFVLQPNPWLSFAIIALCAVLTFVPSKWVHPMRVVAWRGITLGVTMAWLSAAMIAVWSGFGSVPLWVKVTLLVCGGYMLIGPRIAQSKA